MKRLSLLLILLAGCSRTVPFGSEDQAGTVGFPPHSDGSCNAGLVDCSGKCSDLTNESGNCGACGQACASGQSCHGGVCGNGTDGGGDSCITSADCGCGQGCTNHKCLYIPIVAQACATDSECSAKMVCIQGRCDCGSGDGDGGTGVVCPGGLPDIAALCADGTYDGSHWNSQCQIIYCEGHGGVATSGSDAGINCSNSAACIAGDTCCGATCVNLLTDHANCGACAQGCSSTSICSQGTCKAVP